MKVYLIAISQNTHTFFLHGCIKNILYPLIKAEMGNFNYDFEKKEKN